MGCYTHLTISERECLLVLYSQGKSIREIAGTLNRCPSTLSRELRRNADSCSYSAAQAQKQYQRRREKCVRKRRLDDPLVLQTVTNLLNTYWSPEQICNRLKLEKNQVSISMATIYRGLDNRCLEAPLRKKLRRKGHSHKKHLPCGHLPISHSIHDRPHEVNSRSRLGDWECDTVRGANNSGGVATLVDRMSRMTLAAKLPDRTAAEYTKATIWLFERLGKKHALTLTCDHGKEFAWHEKLAKELDCTVYFADPGQPGQRGTNENTNGLLRQFMPKRTSFAAISQEDVDSFIALLNLRPRKCLGWKTPFEIFFAKLLHLT